ncbi:MAG: YdcF family protein [Alphaproteobacteria bacterium]|nr:YdcF family protein [Alphaproteobacteria bacterium]
MRPRRKSTSAVWRLVGALGLVVALWAGGLFWFVRQIPDRVADTTSHTDAIVVLTGGSERLGAGLELLEAKMAGKLFISGVYHGVEVAELLRLSQQAPAELDCCITLGYDAEDTVGNAHETAAWMAENGFHSLRIVTANYHIPRGLLEFRRALPQAVLIPNPVFPAHVRLDGWWRWPGTTRLVIGEYDKFLAASLRGVMAQLFSGAT